MAVPLRIRRNPLAYPAGRAPGFNPAHPAAKSVANGNGFSAIATGATVTSLLSGQAWTPSASPSFALTTIGPGVQFSGANSQVAISNQSSSAVTAATLAVICTFNSLSAAFQNIAQNCTSAFNAVRLAMQGTTGKFNFFLSGNNLTTFTASVNTPYFVAVSGFSSGTVNWVIVNLASGQVIAESHACSAFPATSMGGQNIIGNNSGQPMLGIVAAAMYSADYLPLTKLLQWAADPWSFWYPNDDAFNSLVGVSSSAFLAAWAMGRNQVQQGWAT